MGVDVDKTRGHDLSTGVDFTVRRTCNVWGYQHNGVSLHRKLGAVPAVAGPVDYPAISDQQVIFRSLSKGGHNKQQRREQKYSA
jgi:hypothetical protein